MTPQQTGTYDLPGATMIDADQAERAVRAFTNHLLNGTLRGDVMKVILFGSFAKHAADKRSDVDVLVVLRRTNGHADTVADAAFQIQMEHHVGLEPLVVNVAELHPLTSCFLHTVFRTGREVYTMSSEELKLEARRSLVSLAEEYLDGAQRARGEADWRIAVDAAYNAAELAVKSLVLKRDEDLPGSHGGLVGRLGELYVKTGTFHPALGRRLNRALERKNLARHRYDASVTSPDADELLALAREMIALARAQLPAAGPRPEPRSPR